MANQGFENEKVGFVKSVFSQIAGKYDFANFLISLGRHRQWVRKTVQMLHPASGKKYLDIGCGTGDIAFEILKSQPESTIVAVDFSIEMIKEGRKRPGQSSIHWVVANAEDLPFKQSSFDGVTSGYLIRNVSDINKTLSEQFRVLSLSGKAIALDTTPPAPSWFFPIISFYLHVSIPIIGGLISGNKSAYRYLARSTQNHIPANRLTVFFLEQGFTNIHYFKFMFGTIAIHYAEK